MPVEDGQVEVAVRGASQPLAQAGARDVMRARDLGDVVAAIDAGERREDLPCVVGLPGQRVAR
jgi:hypothetical protein